MNGRERWIDWVKKMEMSVQNVKNEGGVVGQYSNVEVSFLT